MRALRLKSGFRSSRIRIILVFGAAHTAAYGTVNTRICRAGAGTRRHQTTLRLLSRRLPTQVAGGGVHLAARRRHDRLRRCGPALRSRRRVT